ncbi:hypothetical protein AURANDRAFT_72831, partial [Aureococcus anophagefferens]
MRVCLLVVVAAQRRPLERPGQQEWEPIHKFLHAVDPSRCADAHVIKGENENEPDVHVCMDFLKRNEPCVVYSIGIANNWLFDDLMLSKGCRVFSFDPTMSGDHKRHPERHTFEPIGIGAATKLETRGAASTANYGGRARYRVETLADMMARHGHDAVTVLRMDVEGAEWDVLAEWLASSALLAIADQLLLEIHLYRPRGDAGKLHDLLAKMRDVAGWDLFWTARNRWDNHRLHGDMTRVHELGFISCDLATMRLTLSAALLAVAVDGFASKRLPSLRQGVRVQDANAVTEVSFDGLDGSNARIGIIRTKWNPKVVDALSDGAKRACLDVGVLEENIFETQVPGAWELPSAARFLALSGRVDAIVCIGTLI